MTIYRNTITYTSRNRDGLMCEYVTEIDRKRRLTVAGAQRILRQERRNNDIAVSRVEAIAYA